MCRGVGGDDGEDASAADRNDGRNLCQGGAFVRSFGWAATSLDHCPARTVSEAGRIGSRRAFGWVGRGRGEEGVEEVQGKGSGPRIAGPADGDV